MPSIKDFENKNKKTKIQAEGSAVEAEHADETSVEETKSSTKRRPAFEDKAQVAAQATDVSQQEVRVVDVEEGIQEHNSTRVDKVVRNTSASGEVEFEQSEDVSEQDLQKPKIEIQFSGSELIRAKFPRPFQIVEKVATDWVHEGDFSKIPLGHPLLEYAAKVGLQRAKKIEKQVMESPATEKIATQVLITGMKAQGVLQQLKSKIGRGK